jgi:hypothetical protein
MDIVYYRMPTNTKEYSKEYMKNYLKDCPTIKCPICPNGKYRKYNKYIHEKTAKHKKYLAIQEPPKEIKLLTCDGEIPTKDNKSILSQLETMTEKLESLEKTIKEKIHSTTEYRIKFNNEVEPAGPYDKDGQCISCNTGENTGHCGYCD